MISTYVNYFDGDIKPTFQSLFNALQDIEPASINGKLWLIKEIKDRTGFSLRLCKEFTDLLYGHGFCKYNKYTDTYSFDISKITSYTDLLFLNEKSASIEDLHIKRLIEII